MQLTDLRLDAGWIVPIEPAGALRDHALRRRRRPHRRARSDGGRRSGICGARAPGAARPRAAARARQCAHARGDEPLPRNCRRRPAASLAGAAHLAARGAVREPGLRLRRRPARGCGNAARGCHVLQRHVLLPRRERARLPRAGDAGDAGVADPGFSDALRVRRGRLPADGARDPRCAEARARPGVLAVAACAVHRRRRHLGEDRRLRAAARPADPDPSRGNGGRGRAEPRTAWAHAARQAARPGCNGARLHRDPRRAPRGRRSAAARGAGMPRRALPRLQHEARQRRRAGFRAAGGRRERRSRHGRGRVEQPPGSLRRNARGDTARQGRDGRSVDAAGAAGAARGDPRRRARAGPRRQDRLAGGGQGRGRRGGRPLGARRRALLRSGLAPRQRRGPRCGDRRVGRGQAYRRPAASLPRRTRARSSRARDSGRSDFNEYDRDDHGRRHRRRHPPTSIRPSSRSSGRSRITGGTRKARCSGRCTG